MLFVTSGVVLLGTGTAATDTALNAINRSASGALNRATTSDGAQFANGTWLTDTGQLSYVDATAGLPAGTVWCNGLPMSGGKLCTSTDAAATYSNGIPMAANGAVSVGVIP